MPRPKKTEAERKNEYAYVRLTAEEKKLLNAKMRENGYKVMSLYLRDCGLRQKTFSVSPELRHFMFTLGKLGNNINQIAKAINSLQYMSKSERESFVKTIPFDAVMSLKKELDQVRNTYFSINETFEDFYDPKKNDDAVNL